MSNPFFPREKLDQVALDIEFLLISVVQAVALGVLASEASTLVENLRFEFWIYIVCAFLIILVFWSGAIIHAISFVDWPIDLPHSFLYFLASFIEVMAFSQIVHPQRWFAFMAVFFVVAQVLYIYDLKLITEHGSKYLTSERGKNLYKHIVARQKFEMSVLVPLGIIGNLLAYAAIEIRPALFLDHGLHFFLAVAEAAFFVLILINSVISFRSRSKLISEMV